MKNFTVTKIDKHENETQVHMVSNEGDTLRFYAHSKEWTFKAFFVGKITKRQLGKIIDIWYVGEKNFKASVGDMVTA